MKFSALFMFLALTFSPALSAQHPTVPAPAVDCDPTNPKHLSGAEAFRRAQSALHLPAHVCWTYVAAVQGLAIAQSNWGADLMDGIGVDQSQKEALPWYRKAAAQNYGLAFLNLAVAYENGTGTPVDLEAAKFWRARAMKDKEARARIQQNQESEEAQKTLEKWFASPPPPPKHYCDAQEKKYWPESCDNISRY